MRMRDLLQLIRTIGSNVTVKLDGRSLLPSIEISGKGLLELHSNSIWVATMVGDGFLKRRIMWEDFRHEFRFVDPAKRGIVCREALAITATALKDGRCQVTNKSSAEYAIIDLIVAAESIMDVAARELIVDRDDYNRWVRDIGGGADEKMSEEEHLASLVEKVREVRRKTYPIWSSLIDLLPEGSTKDLAQQKLKAGYQTVGLDGLDVMPDWQIMVENNA
jgi:hypothetical protein